LGLGPVAGDVIEVLGVGGDLLKHAPGGLDVSQVLFALILAAAFVEQAVLSPDAFESAVAEGEIELADEAAGAEGEQLLAQSHDLLFESRGSLVGLMLGSAGVLDQAAQAMLLETA